MTQRPGKRTSTRSTSAKGSAATRSSSLPSAPTSSTSISQIETEYIQIMATTKLVSTKVTVDIDFGQRNKAFALKDTEIRDENNQVVNFNSIIDALNFMSANGYEFVQAYTVNVTNTVVYYYVMRRKKK